MRTSCMIFDTTTRQVDGSDPNRGRQIAANSSDLYLRPIGAWRSLNSWYIAQHGAVASSAGQDVFAFVTIARTAIMNCEGRPDSVVSSLTTYFNQRWEGFSPLAERKSFPHIGLFRYWLLHGNPQGIFRTNRSRYAVETLRIQWFTTRAVLHGLTAVAPLKLQ
jgi:hypothetical protein